MTKAELNWDVVRGLSRDGIEWFERSLREYWGYMDREGLESDDMETRGWIIQKLERYKGSDMDYEQLESDEGRAEILNLIEATRLQVHSAYEWAKKTGDAINRGKGGREVSLAITKLQEAKGWLHEALIEAN